MRPELMRINSRYKASSLYSPTYSNAPVYPRHYRQSMHSMTAASVLLQCCACFQQQHVCRHSIESLHRPELPPNTRPFRETNTPLPMHGYSPAPHMHNYPPLKQVDRRASSSNFEYGGRRSMSAQVPRATPHNVDVQRPDYMQRWDSGYTSRSSSHRVKATCDQANECCTRHISLPT